MGIVVGTPSTNSIVGDGCQTGPLLSGVDGGAAGITPTSVAIPTALAA
jgi:hypothetical protein